MRNRDLKISACAPLRRRAEVRPYRMYSIAGHGLARVPLRNVPIVTPARIQTEAISLVLPKERIEFLTSYRARVTFGTFRDLRLWLRGPLLRSC